MDDSEEDFLEVAEENSVNFSSRFLRYNNVNDFLHRDPDENIVIRSVNVSHGEQLFYIRKKYDVDGIVLTLSTLKCISFNIGYLNFLPKGRNSMIPMYSILKKHVLLSKYNVNGLRLLRQCRGLQLLSSNGWQVNAVVVPNETLGSQAGTINLFKYEKIIYDYFEKVKGNYSELLASLSPKEMCLDTIKKNKIYDVSSWRVLHKDQSTILDILERAFCITPMPQAHRLFFIAFRFGERSENAADIYKDFTTTSITEISVHAAVTLRCEDEQCHLFWSRTGVQAVIGNRGVIRPTLSFRECCNFQTNLDGKAIDISQNLREVCKFPDNITFMQLYADSPHMSCDAIHPISGVIGTSGLLHHDTCQYLQRRCKDYLSVSKENSIKLTDIIDVRLEVVVTLNSVPKTISAVDILSEKHIDSLLHINPIIVLLKNEVCTKGEKVNIISMLNKIGNHISETLTHSMTDFIWSGKLVPTWKSYQYELCNEIFWWGRLNSYLDSTLAINLGPGDGKVGRSSTYISGFLCLNSSLECAIDEHSPPPVSHWTNSAIQKNRIRRLFSFGDFLSCNDQVLGTRSLLILMEDLKSINTENPDIKSLIADLRYQSKPAWGKVIGCISRDQLAVDLSRIELFKFPFVFGQALKMIQSQGRSLSDVIKSGINNLRFTYFPCYRIKPSFQWSGYELYKVNYTDFPEENVLDVETVMGDIHAEMEVNNLVFQSKLKNSNCGPFPWIKEIYKRLRGNGFSQRQILKILTFSSCICLIQNGWYVNFSSLLQYERNMGISQESLQELKVLSVFNIQGVIGNKLHRIHNDIPTAYKQERNKMWQRKREIDINEHPEPLDVPSNNVEQLIDETVARTSCKHIPARSKTIWSELEVTVVKELLNEGGSFSYRMLYEKYQKHCSDKDIPDRTFPAFKSMCLRIKKIS